LLGSAEQGFPIIVEHEGGDDDLRQWARGLSLREADRRIPLQIGSIAAVDHPESHRVVHDYVRARTSSATLFQIEVQIAESIPVKAPRSVTVLDLVHGAQVERQNAVAMLAAGRQVRIAFATDLHVSHAWSIIGDVVTRHAPDLLDQFCHPQSLLARFVAECNELASQGDLDLVVLGGDLVDHVYRDPIGHGSDPIGDSNPRLLLDLLAPLRVPVVAIPGNHDYRVNPWRPRAFGLGSVGIPKQRLASVLKAANCWQPWRLTPSDRHALRTHDDQGSCGLLAHLLLLAPATDIHLDLRGLRLVFFATGRDMVLRWRNLDWQRRILLARALPSTWVDPDSEGPSRAQIQRVSRSLDGAAHAALFFHAPLLSPQPNQPVESRIDHLHPGERIDTASQVAFETRLQRSGLRRGVSFRNTAPLLNALAGVRGGVTTFSGHVHRSSRIDIDRRSLRPRTAAIEAPHDATNLTLHIGASLGHVRGPGEEPPGYLLAHFDDGRLRSVRQVVLSRHPSVDR